MLFRSVVVADHYRVDMGQIGQCNGRRLQAFWASPRHGAGTLMKMGIDQQVLSAYLPKRSRVTDPCDRDVAAIGFQVSEIYRLTGYTFWAIGSPCRPQVAPLPAPKPLANATVIKIVVVKAVDPVMRLGWVIVRIGGTTTR